MFTLRYSYKLKQTSQTEKTPCEHKKENLINFSSLENFFIQVGHDAAININSNIL